LVFIPGTAANVPHVVKSEMQSTMCQPIVENVPGVVQSLVKTGMTGHKIVTNVQNAVKPVKINTHG
jgi:hypothetical protein